MCAWRNRGLTRGRIRAFVGEEHSRSRSRPQQLTYLIDACRQSQGTRTLGETSRPIAERRATRTMIQLRARPTFRGSDGFLLVNAGQGNGTGKSAAVRRRNPRLARAWVPRSVRGSRHIRLRVGLSWRDETVPQSRFPTQVRPVEKSLDPPRPVLESRGAFLRACPRMVRDGCISVRTGVIPDLVTSGGLTIELESAGVELPDDLAIAEACEAAHLCGHHNGVIVVSRSRGKRDFAFSFAACLYKLSRHVSGNVQSLGNRSPLRHQAGQFVGSCHPNPLRQFLNLDAYGEFHVNTFVNVCTTPILRARIDPVKRRSTETTRRIVATPDLCRAHSLHPSAPALAGRCQLRGIGQHTQRTVY